MTKYVFLFSLREKLRLEGCWPHTQGLTKLRLQAVSLQGAASWLTVPKSVCGIFVNTMIPFIFCFDDSLSLINLRIPECLVKIYLDIIFWIECLRNKLKIISICVFLLALNKRQNNIINLEIELDFWKRFLKNGSKKFQMI